MQYAGASWDELRYIRQAVGFLVIHQKPKKSLDEITHDLCPILSIQQLYRISTMYWDDKYGTHSVAPEVSVRHPASYCNTAAFCRPILVLARIWALWIPLVFLRAMSRARFDDFGLLCIR